MKIYLIQRSIFENGNCVCDGSIITAKTTKAAAVAYLKNEEKFLSETLEYNTHTQPDSITGIDVLYYSRPGCNRGDFVTVEITPVTVEK